MKRVAGWVCGTTATVLGVVGCGDEGGGPVSNSSWRLWDQFGTTYDQHFVNGTDGQDGNVVECYTEAQNLIIRLVDRGMPLDTNDDGVQDIMGRKTSAVRIEVNLMNQNICEVQAAEQDANAPPGKPPEYVDECGPMGGCMVNLSVQEETHVTGTVRCTQMTQTGGGNPRDLANQLEGPDRTPMVVNIDNCNI